MLTVKDTTADKVTGLESGADDYLPKPYSEIELNARIYAALRMKRLQDEQLLKNRQLQEMLTKVETLAITDPLTGLFNRRRFENILELEFKRTIRYKTPLSCMLVDIDHFKSINDTFGHHAGDCVLKEVALVLQPLPPRSGHRGALGGEEFVVILPSVGLEGALVPANRILQSISEHVFSEVGERKVTVSIGLAAPERERHVRQQLAQLADVAMYNAKRLGRNRVETAR